MTLTMIKPAHIPVQTPELHLEHAKDREQNGEGFGPSTVGLGKLFKLLEE